MTPEERQASLDNISAEDLQKIRQVTEKGVKIEIEDLIEAEFALKFGWEAYRDMKADLISTKTMMKLLVASRKLDDLSTYNAAWAAFVGSGSMQSKRPGKTFTHLTQSLVNNIRSDV